MSHEPLPSLAEIEGHAAELLELTGFESDEQPSAVQMIALLEIPVRRESVGGSPGWHHDGVIYLAPHLTGEALERVARHELGHWFLSAKKLGSRTQEAIMDDFCLCWLAPARAVQAKIRDAGGIAFALPAIVATWGHLDADGTFPVRLVVRAAHLARAAVTLWVGRERTEIGGGPYEINAHLNPKAERQLVDRVRDSGRPALSGPVSAWPVRWQDVTAVAVVLAVG